METRRRFSPERGKKQPETKTSSDNSGRKMSPAKRNSSTSITGRGGKQCKMEDRVTDSSSLSDKYSDSNDGTPGKNIDDSDDIWNNNLNTRQELFKMLEDKDKKIKGLELELNMTKTKNQQNKKKV
jgi:hypothetical protein